MTSVADAIGTKVDQGVSAGIWWYGLTAEILGALITLFWVRIPKEVEKEHVD